MKLKPLAVAAFILTGGVSVTTGAATLLFEDFEDADVTYTTSVAESSNGDEDYFTRTDGTNTSGDVVINNVQGSFHFGAQDINGLKDTNDSPLSAEQTQTFGGINIAGFTGLSFSAFFAEDDSSDGEQDWDRSDFVHVDYRIDGGPFEDLFWLENDGVGTSSNGSNSAPFVDTDFDGTGDGTGDGTEITEITDTMTQFTRSIAGTGSSLDLRITYKLNAGDEDIAIDNVTISGVTAVPEPATLGLGLVGAAMLIRRWGRGVQVA